MVDWLANAEIFVSLSAAGLGLILAVVATLAWRRLAEARFLYLAASFAVLAGGGALLSVWSWQTRASEPWLLPLAVLLMVALLLQYGSVRAR